MTEAILLVGGQGTRLRPLTERTPKPMLPVAGVPATAHQLAKARDAGIRRIILATSYLADVFEPYFGDGSAHGVELVYAVEESPLGTGGAIANAGRYLQGDGDAPITVFNGDVLSGHDLPAQIQQHLKTRADLTLYLTEVDDARAYGCVPSDSEGRVTAFLEKMAEPITNRINAGCYIFRRSIIDRIPSDQVVSVERETFPELLAAGANVRAFIDTAYWLDLGTPEAFVKGSRDLVLGRIVSSAVAQHSGEALISESALIAPTAQVDGGSTIGAYCSIGADAHITGSILLDHVQVAAGAKIRDSFVGHNTQIGERAQIDGAAIGDKAMIGDYAQIATGARVGYGEKFPPDATP